MCYFEENTCIDSDGARAWRIYIRYVTFIEFTTARNREVHHAAASLLDHTIQNLQKQFQMDWHTANLA